jgi:CRP-like cAMP-binding protein
METDIFLEEIQKRTTFPAGEYDGFRNLWEPRSFKRSEFISRGDEIPKFSVFVVKGCIRQYMVSDDGNEHVVYFAEERHFIGDLSAMRNKIPSKFYLQALEPTELLVISTSNWEKASEDFPWWATAHQIGFQKWTARIQQQMAESVAETAEARYLKLLKEKPALFQRVSQHHIASYLGITPETLSRIRKKLYNI